MPSCSEVDTACRSGDYVYIVEPANGNAAPAQLRVMGAVTHHRNFGEARAGHVWVHLWGRYNDRAETKCYGGLADWRLVALEEITIRRRPARSARRTHLDRAV